MSSSSTPRRYRIEFTAEESPVPAIVRVRQLLKHALRALGLRCVAVHEVTEEPKSPDQR